MKKKLIIPLALLLTITLSANAQKEQPTKIYVSTAISHEKHFSNIVVNDGIDLVLTENSQYKIWFDGKEKNLEKVKWEVKDGTLYLASRSGSLKDKVKAYVYVQQLNHIRVNGDSWVKSSGYLTSPSLSVLVNGEALVDILNAGKISVENSRDFELGVMKKTRGVSVTNSTIK